MIVELPDTTTAKIAKALVNLREEGGAVALGRVLTLLISTEAGAEEEAIAAAIEASREHPMRVIVLSVIEVEKSISNRLDAEVRVGGDAGASEVIVLRAYGQVGSDPQGIVMGLLLPDTPVVAWWPGVAPRKVSDAPLGRIAQTRITDAAAHEEPLKAVDHLAETYAPGDTDFAWTRLTLWRTQLAAVLDQPPYDPVTEVHVKTTPGFASGSMLAAWLKLQLDVPVSLELEKGDAKFNGVRSVLLKRASGDILLKRLDMTHVRLEQEGQPTHDISMPMRNLRDCLAEELRRPDPDKVYGRVVTQGIPQIVAQG